LFSLRAQYSSESLQALIQNPVDRSEAIRTALAAVNGKLLNCYSTIGGNENGTLIIYEVPDAACQSAWINTLIASNALRNIETSRLFSPEETVDALRKAQNVQKAYQSPTARR
jgi:uncharacterized protein with GYD domain